MLILPALVIWATTFSSLISGCGTFIKDNGLSIFSAYNLESFGFGKDVFGGALAAIANIFPDTLELYPVAGRPGFGNGMAVIYMPAAPDGSEVSSVTGGTGTSLFDTPASGAFFVPMDNSSTVWNDSIDLQERKSEDMPEMFLSEDTDSNEDQGVLCKQYGIEDHVQAIIDLVQTPEELQVIMESMSLKMRDRQSLSFKPPPENVTLATSDKAELSDWHDKLEALRLNTTGGSTSHLVKNLVGTADRLRSSILRTSASIYDSLVAVQVEANSTIAPYVKTGIIWLSALAAYIPQCRPFGPSFTSMLPTPFARVFEMVSIGTPATLAASCALCSFLWASLRRKSMKARRMRALRAKKSNATICKVEEPMRVAEEVEVSIVA